MVSNEQSHNTNDNTEQERSSISDKVYFGVKVGGFLLFAGGFITPLAVSAIQTHNEIVSLRQHLEPKVTEDGFTLKGINDAALPDDGWGGKKIGQIVVGPVELEPGCIIDSVSIDYSGTPDNVQDASHYQFTNYVGGTLNERTNHQLHRTVTTQTGAIRQGYNFENRQQFEELLNGASCQELAAQVNASSVHQQVNVK